MSLETHSRFAPVSATSSPRGGARWLPESRQRLVHAIFVVFIQMALNLFAFVFVARAVVPDGLAFDGSRAEFLFAIIVGALGLINVAVMCKVGRVSPDDLGWHAKPALGEVAWGTAGFLVCATVIGGLTFRTDGAAGFDAFVRTASTYGVRARLLVVVIGASAALYEESIFRGYLQPALVRRWGPLIGIGATAAVFSLYHMQWNAGSLGVKFCFGLVFGGLAYARRSLVPSAVAHALVWAILGGE